MPNAPAWNRRGSRRPSCRLLVAALSAALLIGACGGEAAPAAPAATDTPAPTATPALTATPAPATPTSAPSPTASPVTGIPVYGYTVVDIFPHDPNAWTQGLQYVDGFLYEGTGRKGQSSLRRVELETGAVLQQHDLDAAFYGEGILVLGDRIYQITWQEQTAFVYDRETFEELERFAYPTEGWGLTADDAGRIILSDGSDTLYFRDPTTFEEVGRLSVRYQGQPVLMLNELEFIDGEIWANVWQTDTIVRIDPASGDVVGFVDLTGLLANTTVMQPADVLNGIAYDAAGDRLFVTGKLWPAVFEIDIQQIGFAQ